MRQILCSSFVKFVGKKLTFFFKFLFTHKKNIVKPTDSPRGRQINRWTDRQTDRQRNEGHFRKIDR